MSSPKFIASVEELEDHIRLGIAEDRIDSSYGRDTEAVAVEAEIVARRGHDWIAVVAYLRSGRSQERAAIVAWMRAARTPHAQADAIERGDHLAKREARVVAEASPPWFDTCQTLDCEAWPTWRVVDALGRVVRGSYNCDEHRPQEQPRVEGERYEHREPVRPIRKETP